MSKISTICDHCNTDFELEMHNGGKSNNGNKIICHNFMNCPHCNKRNDRWIEVEIGVSND